jgi:hypothetical protein
MLRARPELGARGLDPLRQALTRHAPGYGLDWWVDGYQASRAAVVLFAQEPDGFGGVGERTSPLTRGDVVVLQPGEALDAPLQAGLAIQLPASAEAAGLPTFLRPDHDLRFTDRPGGCAEEERAYRRILLTWSDAVGPFVLRALNCHRVRMDDSLSHYHRPEGGFDELYLVQEVREGACIWWGPAEPIVAERAATAAEARALLRREEVAVGDLLHVPRGTVHRAVGGVLAQVITVPGFVPGAELGVDHHLRRLAERFELGPEELPFRAASSEREIVR